MTWWRCVYCEARIDWDNEKWVSREGSAVCRVSFTGQHAIVVPQRDLAILQLIDVYHGTSH